jgi:hypothetical protein
MFGVLDLDEHDDPCTTSCWRSSSPRFLLIYRVIHSPFGNVLKAIRENEPRAISLGYDAERYKLLAFVLSAALAGLAGATKAIVFQLASLTDVHWTMSGEVVLMTLLGGMGTIFGPVVGAFTIIVARELSCRCRPVGDGDHRRIFVVCVLAFRRGIVGGACRHGGSRRRPSDHGSTRLAPALHRTDARAWSRRLGLGRARGRGRPMARTLLERHDGSSTGAEGPRLRASAFPETVPVEASRIGVAGCGRRAPRLSVTETSCVATLRADGRTFAFASDGFALADAMRPAGAVVALLAPGTETCRWSGTIACAPSPAQRSASARSRSSRARPPTT